MVVRIAGQHSISGAPTMTALTKLVPASQITYGTDYLGLGQFTDMEEAGLSAAELEYIGSGNATRLIRDFEAKEQGLRAHPKMS